MKLTSLSGTSSSNSATRRKKGSATCQQTSPSAPKMPLKSWPNCWRHFQSRQLDASTSGVLVPRRAPVLAEGPGADNQHLENQRELGADARAVVPAEVVRFGQLHSGSRDS